MEFLKLGHSLKNIISTINANFKELLEKPNIQYKVLFSGTANIPSDSSGDTSDITLSDNLENYDGVIIQREGCGAWEYFDTLQVGTVLKVVNAQGDFSQYMTGLNLYECNCEILSNKKLRLSHNVYSGITTGKAARYIASFEDVPITKIIGIKLN